MLISLKRHLLIKFLLSLMGSWKLCERTVCHIMIGLSFGFWDEMMKNLHDSSLIIIWSEQIIISLFHAQSQCPGFTWLWACIQNVCSCWWKPEFCLVCNKHVSVISWHIKFIEFLPASWCTQNLPRLYIITFFISHTLPHASSPIVFVTCHRV